jgi:hypothetical protein
VNPHGQTIPPAGSALACDVGRQPSTNAFNAGFNPDGFFQVGTTNGEGGCTTGTADVELFNCTRVVFDETTGQFECASVDGEFTNPNDGVIFPNGTLLKYTQAPGVDTLTVEPMGSNNGSGNPNGGAVEFRLKASGDLLVCSADGAGCALCLVPPPPK